MQTCRSRAHLAAFAVVATTFPAAAQIIGPSTTTSPYLLPSRSGVTTTSIFTGNDPASTVGGYRMVGIPDGAGAFDGPNGRFTLVMNHELGATSGIARAHGQAGSFVSRWEIEKATLAVKTGRDFNTSPSDVVWASQSPRALARFCSGDLGAPTAYRFGAFGTDARIHLNGEENGNEGTAWAHIASGPATNASFELPALGRMSWENSVVCPTAQLKTLVVGLDDATPGQVYVYVGTKTDTGNDIARAGLTNGVVYGVRVTGIALETRPVVIHSTFDLAPLGSQIGVTGAALNTASNAASVTNFLRPEDGCWDPRPGRGNDFYFVTTDSVTTSGGRSRLYRLAFTNLATPELGGRIDALLDGTEGQEMFDNLTIDSLGRVLLQEDVGNNARLGRIWLYDIDSASFGEVAIANSSYFQSGALNFLTQDEEASGILDASELLGAGWFLMDMQAHYGIPGELVEGGQILAMYVDPTLTLPVGVASIGRSSPGCNGPLAISVQSIPKIGNAAFEIACLRAPASSAGALIFAGAGLTTPIPVLGIEVWADPFMPPFLTTTATSDASGTSVVPLPIAAGALPGGMFVNQFVWLGPTAPPLCPPLGLSASNAVSITIQP